MPLQNLNIIGESINDSVPSTRSLFESGDLDSLRTLAQEQERLGAVVIDVNIGTKTPEFMKDIATLVQDAVSIPLSIDSPDITIAEAGLAACDQKRGLPILNSISPLRTEMFELYKRYPFRPVVLVSEGIIDGQARACRTADETYNVAKLMLNEAKRVGIPNDDMLFDLGIAPIGSDGDGNIARLLKGMEMIHNDKEFRGVHFSVGLSNFTVMLPAKRKDGSAVKSDLESAFLTLAMPLGLDYVIGSVKRNYRILEADHQALQCLNDCIKLGGFESITRVIQYYKS
ncbi:MAG: dihydropteroate synthase [Planctomycetaceae bacterium]|jgi:5-methyltetrahydrofolate--homocysteine methyltransferase|nr:dihydropteroate synthase [Planctomycetaceae bacterium]